MGFEGTKRFQVVRKLGEGGMGAVYEVLDRERQARVALKTLSTKDGESLARFKNEFRVVQGLQHPNLVRLGELIADEGHWFFTMELVPGVDLLRYVRGEGAVPRASRSFRQRAQEATTLPARPEASAATDGGASSPAHGASTGPADGVAIAAAGGAASAPADGAASAPADGAASALPVEPAEPTLPDGGRLRETLGQVARGLHALHLAGKVHRDIKPWNVRVTPDGRAVLLDFGVAADLTPHGHLSTETHVIGTAAYMAPEQAAAGSVGPEADWYSVGVVLYELLTGTLPFDGPWIEVLQEKQRREPSPPRALVAGVPEDLDALCVDLLRIDPRRRPTATEVLRRLGLPEAPAAPPVASWAETSPFVGRGHELASLREAFARTHQGHTVTVLVHGESGVGKTALVRRFTEAITAADPRVLVLAGRCYERESVPYKGFDGIVDALARHLRRLPREEAAALLPRRAALLPQVFPVLARVEVVARVPRAAQEPLAPQELRLRVFTALREMLIRIAEAQPLVLVIDDLQWTDGDSLLLLGEILRAPDAPPLLLVATVRTAGSAAEVVASDRDLRARIEGEVRELALDPLPPGEAHQLASLLLAQADLATVSADEVVQEASGHPLFLDELVRHVAVQGATKVGPLRLDDALWERITRLEERAQRLIELIAVAGTPVAQETAARAAAVDIEEFARDAELLRAANLARTSGARPTDTIEPYHDRVREAVAHRIEPGRRAECHQRLARAMEAAAPDAELLAIHWRGAGDAARAFHYATSAADQATAALAFDRAARLYRMALELAGASDGGARALRVRLAHALAHAGRGAEAAEVYLSAVPGAGAAEALDLKRRAADQLMHSGHLDEGVAVVSEVLRAMGLRSPSTTRQALRWILVQEAWLRLRGLRFTPRDEREIPPETLARIDLCWSVGTSFGMADMMRGTYFLTRHLVLALQAGEPRRIGRALGMEGCFGRGRRRRAAKALASMPQLMEDPDVRFMAFGGKGFALHQAGRWKLCRELGEEGEANLRDRFGVAWEIGSARHVVIDALYYLGELEELSRRVPTILREALDRGDRYGAAGMRTSHANARWLIADDPDGARRDVAEASRGWSQQGFHLQHFRALLAETEIDLYTGRGVDAADRVARAWPGIERALFLRIPAIRIEAICLHGRSALRAFTDSSEGRHLSAAQSDARRLAREKLAWANALGRLLDAGAACGAGDRARALSLVTELEQEFARLDMALHAAASRRRRGELLGGEEGRALVSDADGWMSAHGIRNPGRLSAMLAPGFPDRP